MKIHRSIGITAAGDKIWPFLVEPEEILKWCHTLKNFRRTSEQRSGSETSFYFEEKAVGLLLKLNFVVTEWVLNERVAFKMTSGNFVKGYEQRYKIEATSSGSRVTCFEDVRLPYGMLGKIIGLFRRSTSETHLERMLTKLKSMAEST